MSFKSCLVLDATNHWILCGLITADDASSRAIRAPGEASLRLAPLIGEVLEEAGTQRPDWIVATRGPGSFTGARLTVSTARDLAQLWDIPVLGVESLVFYAYLCRREMSEGHFGVLIDGKQKRFFARLVEPGSSPEDWERSTVRDVAPIELREQWPANTRFFVDDLAALRRYLGKEWSELNPELLPEPDPRALYDLAVELGGLARAAGYAELRPVYARPDPAEAKYPQGYNPARDL